VKSGHQSFSESTECVRPLTEEEKKAKLNELRAKLAAKRAAQGVLSFCRNINNGGEGRGNAKCDKTKKRNSTMAIGKWRYERENDFIIPSLFCSLFNVASIHRSLMPFYSFLITAEQDKLEQKESERIRRKAGQESIRIQEELREKETLKALEQKKREKEEERLAKERIRQQIEQDKLERKRRAEAAKVGSNPDLAANNNKVQAPAAAAPKVSTAGYDEARIQIRPPSGGPVTLSLPATATLADLVNECTSRGLPPGKLATTFPRKVLTGDTKTMKELGLVPSAALVLMP
jgi:hypothetical protein